MKGHLKTVAVDFESLLKALEQTLILKTYRKKFLRTFGEKAAPTYGNLWDRMEEAGAVQIFWFCAKYEHLEIVWGTQHECRIQDRITSQHLIGLLNTFLNDL